MRYVFRKKLNYPYDNPLIQSEAKGREYTTEQSLGWNAAELVGWAYRGTHETSNQWIGLT